MSPPIRQEIYRNKICYRYVICENNPSHTDEFFDKVEKFVVSLLPAEPRDLVVLAVCVIVAKLRVRQLVAAQEHRYLTSL
jgi:hypothetical protein